MKNVVYFEINNWFGGRDYPLIDFIKKNLYNFSDDSWCKQQKLCVAAFSVDMSINWCVTATFEWVMQNVPELLSNGSYNYDIHTHGYRKETGKVEDWITTYTKKYSDFLRYSDDEYPPESQFDVPFLEYSEDHLGVTWFDLDDFNPEYDDDDEDEE